MRELQYCEILKTNINVINMQDALAYIEAQIDVLRGRYICVSNVHTTVMAYENEAYRTIQNSAAMALPDGGPLSKYSRSAGFEHAERVTGPDLMVELFRRSGAKGYRHYFYGSTQETLDDMRAALERDYPDMVIAGMYAPPFRALTESEDKEIIAQINDARPDLSGWDSGPQNRRNGCTATGISSTQCRLASGQALIIWRGISGGRRG